MVHIYQTLIPHTTDRGRAVPLGQRICSKIRTASTELLFWFVNTSRYAKLLLTSLGWLSTISWLSIIAVDSFLVGGLIQAIIVINDDAYVPQRWQGTLLTWAAAVVVATFNIYFAKHLPLAEGLFCCVHFFAFIPVIAVFWVMTPVKQTASSVFTQFTDNGAGWPNMGATVLVGQVSSMFVVLGQDSVAHMAEEVADAGAVVPKAMVISFLGNLPFTFVLLITQVSASSILLQSLTVTSYAFCIGDIGAALSSRTGFPFIYVVQNATKSVIGTTGFVIVVLVLLVMITISALASSSRQLFAFARDDGLPFSRWLGAVSTSPPAIKTFIRMMTDDKQVDPKTRVPAHAIIATAGFVCVVSLINVGSTVAFNAVLSLASTAMMGTYLLSIGNRRIFSTTQFKSLTEDSKDVSPIEDYTVMPCRDVAGAWAKLVFRSISLLSLTHAGASCGPFSQMPTTSLQAISTGRVCCLRG